MRQIGERVGAIQKATDNCVWLYGYGKYDGYHEPPFGPLGMTTEEMDEFRANGNWPTDYRYTNPRITLDNGSVVWGAQCWWASEARVHEIIGGREVVHVEMTANY